MAEGLTRRGTERLRAVAEQHIGDTRVAFGWDGGFGCSWLVDPARELTVIVLTQRRFESPEPPPAHRDIQAAAYAALA
jgi:CubicO group peptidase (beta-lactamase class C family)